MNHHTRITLTGWLDEVAEMDLKVNPVLFFLTDHRGTDRVLEERLKSILFGRSVTLKVITQDHELADLIDDPAVGIVARPVDWAHLLPEQRVTIRNVTVKLIEPYRRIKFDQLIFNPEVGV